MRPEMMTLNPLSLINNQRIIIVNFHQDFVANMHSSFFWGHMDMGLIYWSNHYEEIQLSKQEE